MTKIHVPDRCFLALKRLFFLVTMTFCVICETPAATDDFNDGTDDGWTRYNPIDTGTWTLSGGTYRLQSSVSSSPGTVGPGRAGSLRTAETYAQFSVAVDIVAWDNTLDQIFGLITRVGTPGLGSTKGYGFTYATRTGRNPSGELEILRIAQEAGTDITTASNFTFVVGQSYRMVFEGEVNQLTAKLFSSTNLTTPLVTLTATDSTYTNGTAGFFTYDNSRGGAGRADVTFDNFFATEVGPKLQIDRDLSSGDMRLSWPAWATNYRLERSYEVPATPASWQDFGVGFDIFDGRFINFDDGTQGLAIYRLAYP